jgi:hypothetical protein
LVCCGPADGIIDLTHNIDESNGLFDVLIVSKRLTFSIVSSSSVLSVNVWRDVDWKFDLIVV